ncbi:MAG: EAL domain-containing protein [Proteobacteria bacterium]|nr:EAL domain-containing protein [Pseudomonadota bacterium]
MADMLSAEQSSTVGLIAQDIEFRVRIRQSLLSMVAGEITPELLADATNLRQTLASHARLNTFFQEGILVISPEGRLIAEHSDLPLHTFSANQSIEIARQIMATAKPVIGKVSIDPSTGLPKIGFAIPIFGQGQQIIALLAGFSSPSDASMLDVIRDVRIAKTGWVTVFSPESELLLSSRENAMPQKEGKNTLFDRFAPGNEGGAIVVDSRGIEVLTMGKRVSTPGWLVQVTIPTAELFEPVRLMKNSIYSLSAILSLTLAFTVWLAVKKSLRPLKKAASRIAAMSAGEQPYEAIPIGSQDEVGQLLAGFNLLFKQRKLAEDRANRYARVNQALVHINQAMVRLECESELLKTVCRIAVESGGMKMAWIGQFDPDTRQIMPITCQGEGSDYLEGIVISTRPDIPEGQGPTGTAFRENRVYLCQDFINDPTVTPWHERGRRFGWGASAVFPINRSGKPRYVMTLYSDQTYAFDAEVVNLLHEMAEDIAFALDNIDREAQRRNALRALKEGTLRLNQAIDLAHLATWEYDIASGLFSFDDRYYALHGTSVEREGGAQMPARQFAEELLPAEGSEWVEAEISLAIAANDPDYNRHFQSRIRRRDGSVRHVLVNIGIIKDEAGKTIKLFGVSQDVTEQKMHEGKLLLLGEITENAADGVNLIKASDGRIQYANRRFHEMFGYAPGELEGKHVSILNAPTENSPWDVAATIMRSLEQHGVWSGELASLKKDGTAFWTSASVYSFLHPEHGLLWINHQTDITTRKQAEEQLRLSAKVFDSSTEGIIVTDASACIISVNPAFTEITGYSFDEVVGKNPQLLGSGLHDLNFFEAMWRSLDQQSCWQGEIWNRRKNGEVFPEWLSIALVRNSKGEVSHYVAFFSDMSERKAAQEKIEFLSYHDTLTGLPNRQFAMDRVGQAIAHAHRTHSKFAVLVIGLDNFKSINDSLGHLVGDEILAAVAVRLRDSMREVDMVCRLGGDVFLVVLFDVDGSDGIIKIAENILEMMALPYKIENQEISSSVSIGIAAFPNDGNAFETLLKNADLAMYRAKDAGRNTYLFFDESINNNACEYLYLRNGLRQALERCDFVLHYQPQIDLHNGELVGAEALLRWNDPELGLIPPGRFITVAEESGLIVPIGEWALQEACRQAVSWQQAGLPKCVVAVNLSAVQFKRGALAGIVRKALDKSGLEPDCLELELTESILIRETENTLAAVRELKMIGVKLSIDDFGTGYSSLSYLKRFNVDKIKIDQSFVRDLITDAGDAAIVQAIIQIAKSLSLKTIAEGVESQGIADKLQAWRCDEAQGYYFARPMPAKEFADYLSDHTDGKVVSKIYRHVQADGQYPNPIRGEAPCDYKN